MRKVIKIYKDGCPPCNKLSQQLDRLGIPYESVEATAEIAEKYQIRSVPVLIFTENGEEVDRSLGLVGDGMIERKYKGE